MKLCGVEGVIMARGKSSGDSGKKRGRGRPSKKDSEHQEVDNVIDAEAESDNETIAEVDGDVDTGDLPAIPTSVQAVKKVIIAPKGKLNQREGNTETDFFHSWNFTCI